MTASPSRAPHVQTATKPESKGGVLSVIAAVIAVPVLLAIAVIAAFVYHRIASSREQRRHPPIGELVSIGDVRLHLQSMGIGAPTVVLDSALAGSSLSWSETQPRLAELTRVVSYDRAGFGWSDRSRTPRTVGNMVDELGRLLSSAEIEPPYVLVGHSYGGWIAQLYTSRHRDQVAGLVLVDAPHPKEWMDPDAAQTRRVARSVRLSRRAAVLARCGLLRWLFTLGNLSLFREHGKISQLLAKTPPDVRAQLRAFWVQPRALESLASQIENAPASAATVFAETCDLGDLPLVVLTAANPDAERVEHQRETVALSRVGKQVVASHSGHWIPLEEPELVVDAVRDIMASMR